MTGPIKGAVQNGQLVDVDFGWFKGRAGAQQTARGLEIAFFGPATTKLPTIGTVGEDRVEVTKIEPSRTVAGMIVVTVRPA